MRTLAKVAVFGAVLAATPANGQGDSCSASGAVYKQPEKQGYSVTVEFGEASGSLPGDVVFTGIHKGEDVWQHTGTYWCYLGSGGCVVQLRNKDDAPEFAERHIVFTGESPRDETSPPPLLVLGGIYQDFWYGNNMSTLSMDFEKDGAFIGGVGPVFEFESCRSAD